MRVRQVLTPRDVAARAGWSRRRMLRHLLKLDAARGGGVLRNVGTAERPRWTVTLEGLREAAPEWCGEDGETITATLDELREEVSRLELMLAAVVERVEALGPERKRA